MGTVRGLWIRRPRAWQVLQQRQWVGRGGKERRKEGIMVRELEGRGKRAR